MIEFFIFEFFFVELIWPYSKRSSFTETFSFSLSVVLFELVPPLVTPFLRLFDIPFSIPLFLLLSFLLRGFEGAPLLPDGFLFLLSVPALLDFTLDFLEKVLFLLLTFEDFVDEEVFESVGEALSLMFRFLFAFGGIKNVFPARS